MENSNCAAAAGSKKKICTSRRNLQAIDFALKEILLARNIN